MAAGETFSDWTLELEVPGRHEFCGGQNAIMWLDHAANIKAIFCECFSLLLKTDSYVTK